MRRILLSGGGGYIGSAVVQALLTTPCDLTVIDATPQPAWAVAEAASVLHWRTGDVRDPALWDVVVREADVIFHLAAIEGLYTPETVHMDYEVNALSVVHLMEACRKQGVSPSIVLASSANIYGLVNTLPVTESLPDKPVRVWSAHKMMGEYYAQILGQQHGLAVTVLRLANVYGPTPARGRDEHIVVNRVLRAALKGADLVLYNNATCKRDYVYIEDVVAAFLKLRDRPAQGFNRYIVGSGEDFTIEEVWRLLAQTVQERLDRPVMIHRDEERALDPSEYRHFVADTAAFEAATGWERAVSLREGLLATAEWASTS